MSDAPLRKHRSPLRIAVSVGLGASLALSVAVAATTRAPSGTGTGIFGAAGCAPVQSVATAASKVSVGLTEWTIDPVPGAAAAGSVGFAAANNGVEAHELVVVRIPAGGVLPVDAQGAVDEEQLEPGALIGEIEPFPAGTTCATTFDLAPGGYLLLCNVVEEEGGVVESHYQLGMVAPFTVSAA